MRLCIVTRSVIRGDGQGRANFEIVKESIRRNHHVTLVSNEIDSELKQHKQISCISFPDEKLPSQLVRSIAFSSQSSAWLRQHRHEFDVLQVYGATTLMPGDVNTAQFVHSAWLHSPVHISRLRRGFYGAYQWLYTALNSHWEKKAFLQAKVVVAVSTRVSKEITELGISEDRIRIILNGVDPQEFFPGHVERKQFNLPKDVPLGLFAGDIRTNRKNLDTVLHALTLDSGIHLAVVGGTAGSPYPQLAEKLGIAERVHFLGYRRDLPEVMKAVDFFVFPSRYEPFGMVVTEAMASGLPVITAETTGAAEIITPESGIVLSDSEDVNGLAQAMKLLANNPDKRKRMGQHARIIAEQHSWISKARCYVDLFEELSQQC